MTAIEVTGGRVPRQRDRRNPCGAGRRCCATRSSFMPHAGDVVERLASSHRLVLITKGRPAGPRSAKLAQSGLGRDVRRPSRSSRTRPRTTYETCLRPPMGDGAPTAAMMVGPNSMKFRRAPRANRRPAPSGRLRPTRLTWASGTAEPPEGHGGSTNCPISGGSARPRAALEVTAKVIRRGIDPPAPNGQC